MPSLHYLPIVTVFSWVNVGLDVDTGYWIRMLEDSSEDREEDGMELSEVLYGNTTCTMSSHKCWPTMLVWEKH